MHAAEVEKSHIEIHGGAQMFERLTKAKAQPRESAQVRPHTQIGPLDMGRADAFQLRIPADWYWDSRNNFGGVVPLRAFGVGLPVEFEQLREVNIRSEVFLDRVPVDAQTIGRKLESASDALAQVADKLSTVGRVPLPHKVGEDHLAFTINRHPNISVSPLGGNVAMQVGFFRVNEGPKLIGLHKSRANVPHASIEKISGLVADREKQGQNRGFVDASGAGDGADTHALKQECYDLCGLLGRNIVPSKGPLTRLRECGLARGAAVALNLVASVESESLCFGVFATDAGHVGFSLVFLREKPDTQILGSECGLRPRLDFPRL